MMDAIKLFFEYVGIFFVLYMIGYASFLSWRFLWAPPHCTSSSAATS